MVKNGGPLSIKDLCSPLSMNHYQKTCLSTTMVRSPDPLNHLFLPAVQVCHCRLVFSCPAGLFYYSTTQPVLTPHPRRVPCVAGERVQLSPATEEVATFYAKMLDHEYTTKEVFQKNFFADWREVTHFVTRFEGMSMQAIACMYKKAPEPVRFTS